MWPLSTEITNRWRFVCWWRACSAAGQLGQDDRPPAAVAQGNALHEPDSGPDPRRYGAAHTTQAVTSVGAPIAFLAAAVHEVGV